MEKKQFVLNKIKTFLRLNAWVLVVDILAFSLSYLLALYVRFSSGGTLHLGERYINSYWAFIPYCTIVSFLIFAVFRLYGGMWQYVGLHDLNKLISANILSIGLHIGISILIIRTIPGHEMVYRPSRPNSGHG